MDNIDKLYYLNLILFGIFAIVLYLTVINDHIY